MDRKCVATHLVAVLLCYCCCACSASEQQQQQQQQPEVGVQEMGTASAIDAFLRRMYDTRPDNCSMENLGPGVVQGLARERFKRQAMIAVTRANLLTYLWKYNPDYLYRESVLYWLVSNLVESDTDIFAAGNCYDYGQFKSFGIFCPYAFRNKKDGVTIVKDLAKTHHYDNELSTEHEWFHEIRRMGLRIINNTKSRKESVVNFFLPNDDANKTYSTLVVNYDDGHWSMPYYDCGGGNIWMITYTVPFFGYDRLQRSYTFKGTSGIDIDLMQVDINQCSDRSLTGEVNVFANTHKCKSSTLCSPISGLGFQRGSYKCFCRDGFYFPKHMQEAYDEVKKGFYFNGSIIEQEYDKKFDGEVSLYDSEYECVRCAPGCDTCEDDKPCLYPINWILRVVLLSVNALMMLSVCGWWVVVRMFQDFTPIKAASPLLLQIILLGAMLSYTPAIVHFFEPHPVLCTLQFWPREIGFAVMYSSILFKTWRIAVVFRPTKHRNVKITDVMLLKRIAMVVSAFAAFCILRSAIGRPEVVMARHSNGMKTFSCNFDMWDFSVAGIKFLLLIWGVWLSILVRKTPSDFNESRFISWAIYNEAIMSIFFNISMFFLHSSGNPDLFYILVFLHSQLTVTGTTAFLFATKAYLLVKAIRAGETRDSQKPRRFVPALASKSATTPLRSKLTMGHKTSSMASESFTPDGTSGTQHSPGLLHVSSAPSNRPSSNAGEPLLKSESSRTEKSDKSKASPVPTAVDIEQQLLLPRLTKLQEQIDTLRDEVSKVKSTGQLNVMNGCTFEDGAKRIIEPDPRLTAYETSMTIHHQTVKLNEVHFDMSCVPTPKSQSETSCKSPTSCSNSTSHSRSADDDSSIEKRTEDTSPLLNGSKNHLNNNGPMPHRSNFLQLNGKTTHQNGMHDVTEILGNGNGMHDSFEDVAIDVTVISPDEPATIKLDKHHHVVSNTNNPRIWQKRNGTLPTKMSMKSASLDVDSDTQKNNVVKCMQFTYV